ncbi:hypothetical protein ONS95_009485 [Cadophora gregata]|uniref:uncharacterized protein n=1 Tax=Cadophora gregata TaxID=51156 RepID=UPI0026DD5526|nr:uncharacterized protein ONS95_009485 [Cadophora gregata]KAK0124536.1 hypothetical protein ONS95_009485 [Cadophora gregata]KAK0129612.1 hypothetical protein ONS96_000176 [Cadophora gregata f. sp. sojae]
MSRPMHKWEAARCKMRTDPSAWFRDSPIENRDLDLLNAYPVSFVDYDKTSFLRKVYHMKAGEKWKQTEWQVEEDVECKQMIASAGGKLVGFDFPPSDKTHWAFMTINVSITAPPGQGFEWGFLSTTPTNIRIFKGPASTCDLHPWDAMILRDCTTNTSVLNTIGKVARRKWDILLMKCCEDFDHPWVVTTVLDAGAFDPKTSHRCLDTSVCGCIFKH